MDKKLPIDEITGRKNLVGKYKVEFTVELTAEDELTLDDVIHACAAGFEGQAAQEQMANISIEKLNKTAEGRGLKVGDEVYLVEDVVFTANVQEDNGLYIVGEKDPTLNEIGESQIVLAKGSFAVINKISKDGIAELIEFPQMPELSLTNPDTDEPFNAYVTVEKASVKLSLLHKVE